MKEETYRASRLVWFTTLLLLVSVSILHFFGIVPATPVGEITISSDYSDLEPSPEPSHPSWTTVTEAAEHEYAHFVATAYSDRGTTASGVWVNTGIVAADPEVLPIGSVIELKVESHSGIYTVLDTGGFIKGNRLDIYIPDVEQAFEFGRRPVKVRILRYGWNISPPNLG
ncbi:MAG TPA: 3D domain-containing protein [Acidobacteriota bacterium]|nr:3D domain-containing protein [Acidobacteriota bacterium]